MTARRAYMVTVLWTGSDRLGQVWASQNRCEVLFFLNHQSHAVQIWPTPKPACSFLTVLCMKLYDTPKWWKQCFVTLQLVWTGVKWNFSSAHHDKQNIIGKLSIRRVRIWNFTRIGPKTKQLGLSIIPAQTLSEQQGLGPTPKRCELPLFLAALGKPSVVGKLLIWEDLICSFNVIGQKINKLQVF